MKQQTNATHNQMKQTNKHKQHIIKWNKQTNTTDKQTNLRNKQIEILQHLNSLQIDFQRVQTSMFNLFWRTAWGTLTGVANREELKPAIF